MDVHRLLATGFAAMALAALPAGCSDEQAERDVRDAGREAQDEAGEAKRDVEKEIED